jgi:hypothetical protein
MRGLAVGVLVLLVCEPCAFAQERDRALDRIPLALERPAPIAGSAAMLDIDPPRTLGFLTLVPPQLRGEMIRVSVPVGEFVMGAVRSVREAGQRRQQAAARRRVADALTAFDRQHKNKR